MVTHSFAHPRARNAPRREVPGSPLLLLDPTPLHAQSRVEADEGRAPSGAASTPAAEKDGRRRQPTSHAAGYLEAGAAAV